MEEGQNEEFKRLVTQGRNLGKLFLLNRQASCTWLNSIQGPDGSATRVIPQLTPEEEQSILRILKEREGFQPWTHRLVETISALPFVKQRFRYQEYVQKVGRLEADGWLVRVYVNHETDEA